MTAEEFDMIVERRINKIKDTLLSKAEEYAGKTERLHNFKRGAAMTGQQPAQVCVGFMVKHLVSVFDIIDDLSLGDGRRLCHFDEKVTDAVNYLILLEGLVKETQLYKEKVNPSATP